MTSSAEALTAAYRSDWARIVAGLIRITGDWALAEDCAQDAFAAAFTHWGADGVPKKPAAWLAVTARNRAIDRLRFAASERSKIREAGVMQELGGWGSVWSGDTSLADDRLSLIFTCAHPALPLAGRVALTLRTVGGLTTSEIAAAFLVSESTMAARITRAQHKIVHAGIPYRVPAPELLGERLSGVLAVLYLVFNEGYSARRPEVAQTAIALATAVVDLMPGELETRGLLALMLLQDSRSAARFDTHGLPQTLEEQDRSRWNRVEIRRGLDLLVGLRYSPRGSYSIQAEIAACHARAAHADETDWRRIVSLYDDLLCASPSPVVELNRAIAVGMAEGPQAGLAVLEILAEGSLGGLRLLAAARADLSERAGLNEQAITYYREAIASAPAADDKRQLELRLARLSL
jgi:RNA polymerase sigma-70 factor (ECF subfamily)